MSKSKSQSSNTTSWFHRKVQLQILLGNCGDDEEEGIVLDRILHGRSVIGETKKTTDIENLRFSDNDLTSFGPLADAQFGTVELVSCRLDGRVYVRKRVSKKFALKNREQCSPKFERHILLLALKTLSRSSSMWTPHMLCAYQCQNFLNIVMEYAAGGSLWDVLESSEDGRLSAADLVWWAPQCVAAIDWLHSRARFVHRDVKPHNFVVRPGPSPRLLLIDFGSAAPLLTSGADGVQYVPKSHCIVPCGTCDYVSPEILQAHEEALVALEMADEGGVSADSDQEPNDCLKVGGSKKILQGDVGYGRETDWWSLGVMLYELAFGVAPFFANDIRQTYARIMNHESNLAFDRKVHLPPALVNFLKGLLKHHGSRLGRRSNDELRGDPYFKGVDWSNLHSRPPPSSLLLPEFTYSTPLIPPEMGDDNSESSDVSKPFAFSALFQSSVTSKPDTSSSHLNRHDPTSTPQFGRRSLSRSASGGSTQRSLTSFIGFSWGPPKDAFDEATRIVPAEPASSEPGLCAPLPGDTDLKALPQHPPTTPKRPSQTAIPPSTVRVTSVRRSAQARPVSDREAMRVLVDCVGQSARKRVLESGKKPKVLLPQFGWPPLPISSAALRDSLGRARPRASSLSRPSPKLSAANAVRKELRFDDTEPQIMPNLSYTNTFTGTLTMSNSAMSGTIPYVPPPYCASDSGTTSELEGPPSPSPSPRPGSAMSMLSMSRRSVTPTVSSGFLTTMGVGVGRAGSEPPEGRPGQRARPRAGSLGSLKDGGPRRTDDLEPGLKDDGEQAPRRARFVDLGSPATSPERGVKVRAPATPHPKGAIKGAEAMERREPRRARFDNLSDSALLVEADQVEEHERFPSTPHPRGLNKTVTKEARFMDVETPLKSCKDRAQSTPHPRGKTDGTRRSAKPPLQARPTSRMTSTPARPGAHRTQPSSNVPFDVDFPDAFSGDDDAIRPYSRRNPALVERHEAQGRNIRSELDLDPLAGDELEGDEWFPDPDSRNQQLQTHTRCRNPSPPSLVADDSREPDFDSFKYDLTCDSRLCEDNEPDLFSDMEKRYKHLMSDIANLSLHVGDFVSRVRDVQ